MPWFQCFVRGEHFPNQMDGELTLAGFYVTRFADAKDAAGAEAKVLQMLQDDPRLALPSACKPSELTRVYFEEVKKVAAEKVPDIQPGFVWFPMAEDEASE